MLEIERQKACFVTGMILLVLCFMLYSTDIAYTISMRHVIPWFSVLERKYFVNFKNKRMYPTVTLKNFSVSQSHMPHRGLFDIGCSKVKFMENLLICPRHRGGRLGNQMFDFASALGIAKTLNHSFVVRPTLPLLDLFMIDQPIVSEEPEHILNITLQQWRNNTWRSNKSYLSYNLTLSGYFRVWGYFQAVSTEVRKSLTIKPKYVFKASKFLLSHVSKNRTLIGVHVRRGDFLREKPQTHGKTVASKRYMKKAMDYFRHLYPNAFFVVVSNGKKWCRQNLAGKDVTFSKFKEPIIDMSILSLCDHAIVTSGSFGWWGGWLSGGTVVYWTGYPRPGSFVEEHTLFRGEYYPSNWIGLDSD